MHSQQTDTCTLLRPAMHPCCVVAGLCDSNLLLYIFSSLPTMTKLDHRRRLGAVMLSLLRLVRV